MAQVEFQAGDELNGDLEAVGFAGGGTGQDDHADANAVRFRAGLFLNSSAFSDIQLSL